jgi:hypothetical protein
MASHSTRAWPAAAELKMRASALPTRAARLARAGLPVAATACGSALLILVVNGARLRAPQPYPECIPAYSWYP